MGCESNGSILLCISSCSRRLGKSWCVQHQVNGIPSNIRLAIVSARSDVCGASNSTWSDMFIESTSTPYGIIIWNGFSTSDSSSSSCSHLAVGSLRQTQFSSSQFCHGLRLSSFRWLCMSRLTQSINLCFGLPLFLLPGGTISRVFLPTYSWSRLFTWPNYISLAFLHLSVMFSTFSFFLMSSFLTWSL